MLAVEAHVGVSTLVLAHARDHGYWLRNAAVPADDALGGQGSCIRGVTAFTRFNF